MKAFPLLFILALLGLATGILVAQTPQPAGGKPFRLVFKGYDGDPKKDPSGKAFDYQIDTLDHRQPSEFLKLGELITNTPFRLLKFEFKEGWDAKFGEKSDVSELTIVNTITGKTAVLPFNKVVDVSATNAPGQTGK